MEWVCKKCGKVNKKDNKRCVSCHKDRKEVEEKTSLEEKKEYEKIKRNVKTILMYIFIDIFMIDVWIISPLIMIVTKLLSHGVNGLGESYFTLFIFIYVVIREIFLAALAYKKKINCKLLLGLLFVSPLIIYGIGFVFQFILGTWFWHLASSFMEIKRRIYYGFGGEIWMIILTARLPIIVGFYEGKRLLEKKNAKK